MLVLVLSEREETLLLGFSIQPCIVPKRLPEFSPSVSFLASRLVFIGESTGGSPIIQDFDQRGFAVAEAAFAPSTSISGESSNCE